MDTTPAKANKLKQLLKLLSETIPVQNIDFHVNDEEQKEFSNPYEGSDDERRQIFEELVSSFVSQGSSKEDAIEQVKILLRI